MSGKRRKRSSASLPVFLDFGLFGTDHHFLATPCAAVTEGIGVSLPVIGAKPVNRAVVSDHRGSPLDNCLPDGLWSFVCGAVSSIGRATDS